MFSLYLTVPSFSNVEEPTGLKTVCYKIVSRMKPRTASEHVAANILMLAILFTLNYAYLGNCIIYINHFL